MLLRTEVVRRWLALLALCALQTLSVARASERIYLIEEEGLAIHLSDRPQGPASRLLIDAASPDGHPLEASPSDERHNAARAAVAKVVRNAARAHALHPELLHAVIATESGYAVRAVSRRGAQGLMQLMPATARSYGVTDAFDVAQNVHAGSLHLRRLLDQFGQNTALALAAYNAGAGAVARYGHQIPPFAETTAYVQRVLQRYAALRSRTPNLPMATNS